MELTRNNIIRYAKVYDAHYRDKDRTAEDELKKWLKNNCYLDKEKFIRLGVWKSPRTIRHYKNNNNETIREATKKSFTSKDEKEKIEILLALNGVGFPVASAILHFAFPNKYSILDFRAIWSLCWRQPTYYNFAFWQKYCERLKSLSKQLKLPIRTIDKALWEYSKENQKELKCK